jgi:hypothetical protein
MLEGKKADERKRLVNDIEMVFFRYLNILLNIRLLSNQRTIRLASRLCQKQVKLSFFCDYTKLTKENTVI